MSITNYAETLSFDRLNEKNFKEIIKILTTRKDYLFANFEKDNVILRCELLSCETDLFIEKKVIIKIFLEDIDNEKISSSKIMSKITKVLYCGVFINFELSFIKEVDHFGEINIEAALPIIEKND